MTSAGSPWFLNSAAVVTENIKTNPASSVDLFVKLSVIPTFCNKASDVNLAWNVLIEGEGCLCRTAIYSFTNFRGNLHRRWLLLLN